MNIGKYLYIGNGAYCYANSTSMLLASIGENIPPSQTEVLSGVGLGAFLTQETNLIFFSNYTAAPDLGISKALDILGFEYREETSKAELDFPVEELRQSLEKSPAILGPLDMSYLIYNPRRPREKGIDHFVLAYAIKNNEIYLHDPAGFPCVSLPIDQLKTAWTAKHVPYRRGYYRYWISPKRITKPTKDEIYEQAIDFFKSRYKTSEELANKRGVIIGKEAITTCAERIKEQRASEDEIGQLTYFALPLGARRTLDFAAFFDYKSSNLAQLKQQQANLFGEAHAQAMLKDWSKLADILERLADTEEEFRTKLLEKEIEQ